MSELTRRIPRSVRLGLYYGLWLIWAPIYVVAMIPVLLFSLLVVVIAIAWEEL